MKFAVGYQLHEDDENSFVDVVEQYKEAIGEVYFPWLDVASGRSSLVNRDGYTDWRGQEKLIRDLKRIKALHIKLDLLFNANCYGEEALSVSLANQVCSILGYLEEEIGGVEVVTTTSPAIAHIVKRQFPQIEIRASVNMRIGTVKGLQYVSHLFDSFYLQREYNRDFEKIREIKAWTEANGKGLLLLANSGCMNFCSGQTFHDNLVAHGKGIDEKKNIGGFLPHICWNYLQNRENWGSVLQNSWIRPEDLHHYEEFFPLVKLATRMHALPAMVLQSYIKRRYLGNLLDLFEPGYGPAFAPYVIDNARFPEDWFDKTTTCDKRCHTCGYCEKVLKDTLVNTEGNE